MFNSDLQMFELVRFTEHNSEEHKAIHQGESAEFYRIKRFSLSCLSH